MSEKPEKRQSLPLWRLILLWLIIAAIVVLCIVILGNYVISKQLSAEIVKISKAGKPLRFNDLRVVSSLSKTGEDASQYYIQALMPINPESFSRLQSVYIFYRQNMSLLAIDNFPQDIRAQVAENMRPFKPVLESLDTAANLSLSNFNIGLDQGAEVCQARLSRIKTITLLLSIRTMDLIAGGQSDLAANSVISTLKLARLFDFCPTILLSVAKAELVSLACEDIRLLLEHGKPSKQSLSKLQQTLSQVIPGDVLEKMFLAERVYQIEVARNLISKSIVSRLLQKDVPQLPERLTLPSTFLGKLKLRRGSTVYFRDMTKLIKAARQPWPKPLDTIINDIAGTKPRGVLSSGAKLTNFTADTFAIIRCTALAIAIERYHHSHGSFPETVDNLYPAYTDSIPIDPFTGNALLYKKGKDSYIIYSAGSNRLDDGGLIKSEVEKKSSLDRGIRIGFQGSK